MSTTISDHVVKHQYLTVTIRPRNDPRHRQRRGIGNPAGDLERHRLEQQRHRPRLLHHLGVFNQAQGIGSLFPLNAVPADALD